ncbi:hypothetical protein DFQ28_000495 [Apophysomyces sp. BC1034]|nr:hypothetical protein DFQ30_010468 [Apophysomyces sp. BC1015]KAG0170648.1 hypothetical protein DFQ29_009167 [Apophysomyces sp. BC1021]KAG0183911.1 hypothetical protein DFQ28_000495 [Apophysomyces sp. BC1034]
MLNETESITKYLGHHDDILNELKTSTSESPIISSGLVLWCHSLTTNNDSFSSLKERCFGIMKEARVLFPDETGLAQLYSTMEYKACELKPPCKHGSTDYSGFVKLALEMRGMLNKMLDIIEVEHAAVFGILVEGYPVSTFKMDTKGQIYRMIQLGNFKLMSQQSDLVLFPVLFRCLLQVKNLAAEVARKVAAAQLERAKGKRKLSAGPSWRSNKVMEVTKQRRASEGS